MISGDTVAGRPTERDQQRGAALRQAREEANLTQQEAGALLGRSQPTIARIESGARPPSPEELQTMLASYHPSGPLRDRIDGYATLPDTPPGSSTSPNSHFVEMQRATEEAERVLTLHSERTPVQLQSEQYSLLQHKLANSGVSEIDVLRAREQRRRIFTRENPFRYCALLSVSSLLRAPGGRAVVVKQQCQYLIDLIDQHAHFSLRILGFQADLPYVDTDFTLLKMPRGKSDMVYVPYGLDGRLIKDRQAVIEREKYWYEAQRAALSEEESKKYLHELAQRGNVF
jgi:transcriptional regulator with XRE-family HTH domain